MLPLKSCFIIFLLYVENEFIFVLRTKTVLCSPFLSYCHSASEKYLFWLLPLLYVHMEVLLQVWGCGVPLHSTAWRPHLSKGRAPQCVTADSQRKRRREKQLVFIAPRATLLMNETLSFAEISSLPCCFWLFQQRKRWCKKAAGSRCSGTRAFAWACYSEQFSFSAVCIVFVKSLWGIWGHAFFMLKRISLFFVKSCLFLESRCYEDNTSPQTRPQSL